MWKISENGTKSWIYKKISDQFYKWIFFETDSLISISATVRFLFFTFLFRFLIWQFYVIISAKLSPFVFKYSIDEIIKGGNCFFVMFRWCFTVTYSNFICYLLSLLIINLPLTFQIYFVTHQHHFNFIYICFLIELIYPKINCFKCTRLGDVKN